MAQHAKLFARIWSDPDFIALDARPQQVYLLLLSHSSRNFAGVLPLTLKRWANATRDATIANITTALWVLIANKFIVVDWDREEVLVRTYIRNDEVYKQPNVMKAALRQAAETASPLLRWALRDELLRLPEHTNVDKTHAAANALVDGIERPPEEGLPEGFAEGLPEPPGVGDYVTGVRVSPTPTPSPTPAAAPAPFAEPFPAESATPGADLVAHIIPREHPDPVKTLLRIRSSELLNAGHTKADVAAALQLWLTKPHLGPNALPTLVSEVIRNRSPAAHIHNGIGKPTQKALGHRAAAEQVIAGMEQTQ